jgi:hypothetical protein
MAPFDAMTMGLDEQPVILPRRKQWSKIEIGSFLLGQTGE